MKPVMFAQPARTQVLPVFAAFLGGNEKDAAALLTTWDPADRRALDKAIWQLSALISRIGRS